MRPGTLLIHNGHDTDPSSGAIGVPLIQTSTFDQGAFFAGKEDDRPVKEREFDIQITGQPARYISKALISYLLRGSK